MKNQISWRWGEKTSIENIRKVEQDLGFAFPKEYIELVLLNNGGLPSPNVFLTKSGVEEIFANLILINEIADRIQLMKEEDRHVGDTVPIYQDAGYAVCLDYRESKTDPKVFFNDYTRSYYDENDNRLTFIDPIADSFKEFLDSLFELDDDDELD